MINTRVITKNWDITKVSTEFNPIELLENWKKAKLSEISLRKNAFKNKENFKKWWFVYLKADSLQDKVYLQAQEYTNSPKATDQQKDFVDETKKIDNELKKHYENLPKVSKLMTKNRKKVLSFIASDETLKKYKVKITLDFLKDEGHDISEQDIKARDATWGVGVLREIWEALERDKEYSSIRDENGKIIDEIKTWSDGALSWDPNIRQKMFESWYSWDRKHRDTLFSLCSFMAARLNQNAEYYKYKSWIEQYANEFLQLSINDYHTIIDYCNKFAQSYLDYHSYDQYLIAKAFNLKEYDVYDLSLRIENTDDSITQAQAKTKILEAFACLGNDYVNKLQQSLDSNIIYWSKEQRRNKGYCYSGSSALDESPIYFNWDGTTKSVATLAHELGHNISTKYIKENNEIDNVQNNLFCETPSVINSVIFNMYWIKTLKQNKVPKAQLYCAYTNLLDYLTEIICEGGFFYQLADRGTDKLLNENWKAADFELYALDLESHCCGMTKKQYFNRRKKWPNVLLNLNCYRRYIYAALHYDVNIAYYIGAIIALAIAPKLVSGDKTTLNKYQKFLKAGTSLDPIKTLKDTLGIDITKPHVYTQAKQQLEKFIKEFKHDIKI